MPYSETGHNIPEHSVSELSSALKRTVEDAYAYVKVRGEISGFKRAASGHMYLNLKDDKAVLASVCWKGTAGKLAFTPEDGLEVTCTGRITTYAGQSKYQLVIESMEPAGEGALMALLEKRKKMLAAEGLFDPARKKPLPFLPEVIGIITSPTGAVIRDILHRLEERFPRNVLLWPVLVQGDKAAEQIAQAIRGFNQLNENSRYPRPDLLIVARGGGSLEDLWAFNEEIVVRAAAESDIPLISAVGHETDVTLIDFAADKRAPTPTAAAEMAVPVRSELQLAAQQHATRAIAAIQRLLHERKNHLVNLSRGLPRPATLLEDRQQRLDLLLQRYEGIATRYLELRADKLALLWHRFPLPSHQLQALSQRLHQNHERLVYAFTTLLHHKEQASVKTAAKLSPPTQRLAYAEKQLRQLPKRLPTSMHNQLQPKNSRLMHVNQLLESYHYTNVLKRGFVAVHQGKHVITSAQELTRHMHLKLEFQDGKRNVVVSDGKNTSSAKSSTSPSQESLL